MSTHPMTACAWRVGPPGLMELRIVERAQMDGTMRYAVVQGGWVANRDREWELEVQPSSRDEAFLDRCRFTEWEDAAYCAKHMADNPSKWDHRSVG